MLKKVIKELLKKCDLTMLSESRFRYIKSRSDRLGRIEDAIGFILQFPEQKCKDLLKAALGLAGATIPGSFCTLRIEF